MTGQKLVVIAGQTGAGKSALAERLAHDFPLEIVSADSVQVYRGFDIGSAKPTREEQKQLPHHLIDIVDPDTQIDAAQFARRADEAIDDIHRRGKIPVVVGGTGLWIRALLMGLVELPTVDPDLRQRLEQKAAELGNDAFHQLLADVDPISAEKIHPNDTLRVVRALEVYTQTRKALGALREQHARGKPRYQTYMLALEHAAKDLRPRLRERTDAMLRAGWIDEVRGLLSKWPTHARAFGSVGYREVCAYLCGELPRDALPVMIERETWRYAKRQRNWFRGERYVDMRGPSTEIERIAKIQIAEFLE